MMGISNSKHNVDFGINVSLLASWSVELEIFSFKKQSWVLHMIIPSFHIEFKLHKV